MTRTCPRCGFENDAESDFCAKPGCGEYLRWEKTVHVPAVRRAEAAADETPADGATAAPRPPEPRAKRVRRAAPPPPPDGDGNGEGDGDGVRGGAPGDGDAMQTLVAPARDDARPAVKLSFKRGADGD